MAGNNASGGKGNGFIVVIVIVILIVLIGSCTNSEEDHNDGKCDICGKAATYSDSEEEYCDKHLESATKWYIEQGQD